MNLPGNFVQVPNMVALVRRAVAVALVVGILLAVDFVVAQIHRQTAEIVATFCKCRNFFTISIISYVTMENKYNSFLIILQAISIEIYIELLANNQHTKSDAIYFTNTN